VRPIVKPTWSDHREVQVGLTGLALRCEKPGREQQRVAGEEEADEQRDRRDGGRAAEAAEQLLRIGSEREHGRDRRDHTFR
jgi:hypothetical protein